MARFYQFTPLDVYHKVLPAEAEKDVSGPLLPNVDAIFPEFLLLFGQNLIRYGNRTLKFHAARLELDADELRFGIKALTGKSFTDFSEDFMVLRIRDLLGEFPTRGSLKEKSRMLGFSMSGLYRFMMRKMKRTPSGWYWY